MRTFAAVVGALLIQLALPAVGWAACGDAPGDAADVAAARADVDATCDCAAAASHAAYVRCASGVLAVRTASGRLSSSCKSALRRCASRSTCGRPGAVTCCRITTRGSRCRIARSAAACATPCAASSCCDACGAGGCVTTSTTTSTSTSSTTSTTLSTTACGDTYPQCDGACPAGERCRPDEGFPPSSCACVPEGVIPCSSATYPECGAGACSGGAACGAISIYTTAASYAYCGCVDPSATCSGNFQGAMCPGLCPAGTTCYGEPEPAGLGNCLGCLPACVFGPCPPP